MSRYYWTLLSTMGGGSTGLGYRYGYEFDGVDENLNFGNVLNNDGSSAFTVSFWLKGVTSNDWIISKQTKRYEGLEVFSGGSKHLELSFGRASTDRIACRSTNTMSSFDWVFCTISYDGSKSVSGVKMYLNGVEETIVTNRDTWTGSSLNSGDLRFGSIPWTSGLRLNGRLDDVQYYNSVLSLSDINDIYNSGYVTAPTASPVHHWKLGEEDTFSTDWTVKDSIGSADGTSINMEEEDRKLGVAYSMNFDGVDEKINFGNILDFATNEAYSISFWFKPVGSVQHMFANFSEPAPRSGYTVLTSVGKVCFLLYNNGSGIYVRTTNAYNAGEWNHISVTYDGSESKLGVEMYLNGVQETLTSHHNSTVNSYTSTGNDLVMGSNSANNSFNYSGNLMDVSVFNSELSASDAALLYNTTGTDNGVPIDPRDVGLKPTFFTPLVGPNDSFNGTDWTIVDEINGNNGTSVNMEEADKTSNTP